MAADKEAIGLSRVHIHAEQWKITKVAVQPCDVCMYIL